MGCTASTAIDAVGSANVEDVQKLFVNAFTNYGWQDKKVEKSVLDQLVKTTLLGPSAFNCSPLRFVFVESKDGKAKLIEHAFDGNKGSIERAPVSVVLAVDSEFVNHMGQLLPSFPGCADLINSYGPDNVARMGAQNASIQIGHFIMAARALGLAVGPMSGFDAASIDKKIFPDGKYKTLVIANIGYGLPKPDYQRKPRLSVAEVTRWE